MKTFLFICGPNGIGKTTVCFNLLQRLNRSAFVDSDACRAMNPFVLDDITIPCIAKNMSDMINNYLACPAVETVLFSYGFHGRRREVFDLMLEQIHGEYRFCPILLICDEDENIRRMHLDGRDEDRIRRAVQYSRAAFNDVEYPQLDVTHLSVEETADIIIEMLDLFRNN
ncbi:MAG: AAA family ATPase [Firmicutes bacterium]|nr:AAA family ATPase [Bacillota bacterium]